MRILYLITRQFNLLMQVKELSEEGYCAKMISERLKMAGFIVRNCLRQAEYFSLKTLKEALQDCGRMEEAVFQRTMVFHWLKKFNKNAR